MPMIDSDELMSSLEAWRSAGAAVVAAVQAGDAAFLRGDQSLADEMHKKALQAAYDRNEKANNLAEMVEGLIFLAEEKQTSPHSD